MTSENRLFASLNDSPVVRLELLSAELYRIAESLESIIARLEKLVDVRQ